MKVGNEHMQGMIALLEKNINYIIIGLAGTSMILLVLIIILFIKNSKLKKRYNEFMRGTEVDIEALLREAIAKSEDIQQSHKGIRDTISDVELKLKKCIQKVGIIRYSAVERVGAELSYAIALLDEEDNGVVLNGIYTRDGSYSYAKQIVTSESKHTLSEEEIEAIAIAKQID